MPPVSTQAHFRCTSNKSSLREDAKLKQVQYDLHNIQYDFEAKEQHELILWAVLMVRHQR